MEGEKSQGRERERKKVGEKEGKERKTKLESKSEEFF